MSHHRYPHSDDTFDLCTIPAERLDTLWLPLDGFNLGLPHRHASRLVGDGFKKNQQVNVDYVNIFL